MLYYMIWAFAFYTLLLMPVFFFYADGDAYNNLNQDNLGYAPRTLGNMGYSAYQCQSIPIQVS